MQATEIMLEGSPYKIVDDNGLRSLRPKSDDTISTSCMRLDDPDAIVSAYLMVMLQWLVFNPQPQDVLEVGLGGGQVARFIRKHLPQTRSVTVEIDADMVDIARRYFGLPDDDERTRVVVGDGGAYIRSRPASCDALLLDAYDSELGFPESMMGEAFARACSDALRGDGPLAINFVRTGEPWRTEYCRMLAKFFPWIYLVSVSPEQQVAMAFKRLGPFDGALLSQRAEMLEPRLRLRLPAFAAAFQEAVKVAAQAAAQAA